MADLTITASQVVPGVNATYHDAVSAVAITAGQTCYLNTSGQAALGDADLSAAAAVTKGVAVNSAPGVGQWVRLQIGGTLTLGAGAAPVSGVTYVQSDTAGGLMPIADLDTGDYVTIVGVGGAANTIKMSIFASGNQF